MYVKATATTDGVNNSETITFCLLATIILRLHADKVLGANVGHTAFSLGLCLDFARLRVWSASCSAALPTGKNERRFVPSISK